MADFKEVKGPDGEPLKGVRYTEHRLAACFDEGEDGFQVLKLLARQQINTYDAARLIQKILKGYRIELPQVEYTKVVQSNDGNAGQLE